MRSKLREVAIILAVTACTAFVAAKGLAWRRQAALDAVTEIGGELLSASSA